MTRIVEKIRQWPLWAVLGAYIVASGLILRVIAALESSFALPGWVFTAGLVLLSIGLPIILSTAFVQRVSAAPGGDGAETARIRAQREAAAIRRVFTWRNALVGGVGGFAALAIGTAAWILGGPETALRDVGAAGGAEGPAVLAETRAGAARSPEEAAAAAFRALGRAIEAMDVEATLAAYDDAPGFTYVFDSELIEGRAAFDARVRGSFAGLRDIELWEIEDLKTTRIDRRHVLVVARFREVAIDTAGSRLSLAGVHTNLFVERDGRWRIARGHTAAQLIDGAP